MALRAQSEDGRQGTWHPVIARSLSIETLSSLNEVIMRRRKPAERFRPLLQSSAIAVAASIDDVSDGSEFRFLLVRYPESWEFKGTDDHRLDGKVGCVTVERRHPDGIPSGRYLRVPVEAVVDPWGRVAIDLAF